MKRILAFVLILTLAFLLIGCAENTPDEPENINDVKKLPATDEEIDTLIRGSTEIWDYLLVNAPSNSWDDSLEQNGRVYYRVTDERYDEWSEWESYILSIFTAEYAEKYIFDGSSVINIDGKTYTSDGSRGKDVGNNYEIVSITGNDLGSECKVEARFPYLFEDMEGEYQYKSYHLVNTDDGWRIGVDDGSLFEYHNTQHVEIPGLSDSGLLSDGEIEYLINEHIRIYNYLSVSCLPNTWDDGKIEIYNSDGLSREYYPVTDERYDTWEEWENYIRAICTGEQAEYWLGYGGPDFPNVINVNGKTYTVDGGRGDDRNNEAFEIISQYGDQETGYTVITRVPLIGEGEEEKFDVDTYMFSKVSDGWRISGWSVEHE